MSENIEQVVADRIREYSDTFGRAFHAHDPTLLRPYCHVPSMGIGGGTARVIETLEDNDKRWAHALAGLPADYDHSVLHTVDVTLMSPTAAWVTADCGRFNTDGTEYARFWASYIAIETDEGWQITTWVGHEPGRTPQTERL